MDFVVFYGLSGTILSRFVFSYDIACQWHRNLSQRMGQLPDVMRLSNSQLQASKVAIPKMHLQGHGLKCQAQFSFDFLPYMAHTDGEDPERWWAHINPVSMSTKEMGPGARLDTLDDHTCAWNWRKIVRFGTYSSIHGITRSIWLNYRFNIIIITNECSYNGKGP
jgi:Kyakuja-Dileera-Zisupton transposase